MGTRQAQGTRELARHDDCELQTILTFLESTLAQQGAVREAYQSLSTD